MMQTKKFKIVLGKFITIRTVKNNKFGPLALSYRKELKFYTFFTDADIKNNFYDLFKDFDLGVLYSLNEAKEYVLDCFEVPKESNISNISNCYDVIKSFGQVDFLNMNCDDVNKKKLKDY